MVLLWPKVMSKKAATPFSAAAHASPPETAAGRRSSNSFPAVVSRRLFHPPRRTSLIWKIAVRKVSCKDFCCLAVLNNSVQEGPIAKEALGHFLRKPESLLRVSKPFIDLGISLSHLCSAKVFLSVLHAGFRVDAGSLSQGQHCLGRIFN